MSHNPNLNDIKTDLRRSVMASFSPKKLADSNFKIFLKKAETNLELLKKNIGIEKYKLIKSRINKSKEVSNPIEKRREDLLTASSLI